MNLRLHTRTRREIRHVVDWLDRNSGRAGDEFLLELNAALENIAKNPTHFHFASGNLRRCNLQRFPYHILYEIHLTHVHVLTVKHHRRHPDYGRKSREND